MYKTTLSLLSSDTKRATDGYEPSCGCWELNSEPLKEQLMLLAVLSHLSDFLWVSEPSLQAPTDEFLKHKKAVISYMDRMQVGHVGTTEHKPYIWSILYMVYLRLLFLDPVGLALWLKLATKSLCSLTWPQTLGTSPSSASWMLGLWDMSHHIRWTSQSTSSAQIRSRLGYHT